MAESEMHPPAKRTMEGQSLLTPPIYAGLARATFAAERLGRLHICFRLLTGQAAVF